MKTDHERQTVHSHRQPDRQRNKTDRLMETDHVDRQSRATIAFITETDRQADGDRPRRQSRATDNHTDRDRGRQLESQRLTNRQRQAKRNRN